MSFKPSQYQQAVFNWFMDHLTTKGALVVEAVAGSGKTTTIVKAAEYIPSTHKAIFLAFSKAIATELGDKLPDHVQAKTLNALGYGVLMRASTVRPEVDAKKTFKLIDDWLPDIAQNYAVQLANIIGKAKSHGMVPTGMEGVGGLYRSSLERWLTLADRYDIDIEDDGTPGANVITFEVFADWADKLLRKGLQQRDIIDFDDQLYMVVAYDLPTWRYDWIIIDEAQDVSHVQRAMLKKFLKTNGRLIAVGDSRQAIYGFRGADNQSMNAIKQEFGASELPLSVSYRCPIAVVEAARKYVPHIQHHEGADQGVVRTGVAGENVQLNNSDMVICRNTAPLIELAYRCISKGIPVNVKGRDIGTGLINLVKRIAGKRAKDIDQFLDRLDTWYARESERARQRGQDDKQQALEDKYESIQAIRQFANADTVQDLINGINAIFETGKGATLSTVHKAKGLEAQRVFILEPHLMPSKYARQDWQQQQENNLIYVAITRALAELVWAPMSTFTGTGE